MEKKFNPDNFEQFLKESTDNFRMYPSKRIWHSIYNDLHPGRKWPSLAIWALLISSVTYIGFSNDNQGSKKEIKATTLAMNNLPPVNASNTNVFLSNQINDSRVTSENTAKNPNKVYTDLSNTNSTAGNTKAIKFIKNYRENNNQPNGSYLQKNQVKNLIKKTIGNIDNNVAKTNPPVSVSPNTNITPGTEPVSINVVRDDANIENNQVELNAITIKKDTETTQKLSAPATKSNNTLTDKEWIEDFAFHNKPLFSKWKTHVSYQFYLTPSIGYRTLSKNTNYNPVSSSLVAPGVNNVQDYENTLSQAAAVNLEIGGNLLYSIAKNWNIKGGIQFNYTNYGINAYELKHPTMTTLTINNLNNGLPELDPRSTSLANTSGVSSKRLNNNTYQVSLPLGADLKLAGKNNLKWYAGATIQPTYIIGGNAFLISSDLKNYVTDKSMMRTLNINTGIETFLSYKTKSGIIINAGPQFRYQILSTYSKQYTYDEKLYNLGLKIGITTRF
jgi:hypothetical protein